MKININNIGIIEEASLKINGLTVITGYNNSGKTTVGKVVYSLFSSVENLGMNILEDQKHYAIKNAEELWRSMYMKYMENNSKLDIVRNNMLNFNEKIKNAADIHELDNVLTVFLTQLEAMFESIEFEQNDRKYKEEKKAEFEKKIKNIIEIVNTRFNSERYVNEKFEMTLKEEFVGQISPLYKKDITGTISVEEDEQKILNFKIFNNSIVESENMLDEYNIDTKVVFLDNVFLLDELSQKNKENNRKFFLLDDDEPNISIKRHKDKLLDEISEASISGVSIIDNILSKEKLEKINKKISQTFNEEIIIANDKIYSSNSKIYIENLAMGSKVFAILKLLLVKGIINDKTVLVLDEPEVHLHPQWQSVLAEILALMVKELGIIVILTTHSPQFLLALEYYMKKYEQKEIFNVYMTEESKSVCVSYREVTDSMQEAYYRLSKPMFDIKSYMDELE